LTQTASGGEEAFMDGQVENYIIGRLTAFGLVDVMLYLIALGLCLYAARRAHALAGTSVNRKLDARFWLLMAIGLGLLAIWKAINVESILQDAARLEATEGAWYEGRRGLQTMIASMGLIGGFALAIGHFIWFRQRQPLVRLASLLMVALVGFIAIRTISLHIVDRMIYDPIGPIRLNWIIEPGLLIGIGVMAWMFRAWVEQRAHEGNRKTRYLKDRSGRRLRH